MGELEALALFLVTVECAVVRLLLKFNTLFDVLRSGHLLDVFDVDEANLTSLVSQKQPSELLCLAAQHTADLIE